MAGRASDLRGGVSPSENNAYNLTPHKAKKNEREPSEVCDMNPPDHARTHASLSAWSRRGGRIVSLRRSEHNTTSLHSAGARGQHHWTSGSVQ